MKPRVKSSIVLKSAIAIILMLTGFALTIIAIGYFGVTQTLRKRYSEDAFWTAYSASVYVEPELIDVYMVRNGDNPYHSSVQRRFQEICDSTGVTFIYVIQPDTSDYNHIKFLFAVKNTSMNYELFDIGYVRETTNEEYRTKYRQLYEGTLEKATVIRDKGYISTDPHITSMIPLKDGGKVVGILCVQVQMDALQDSRLVFIRNVTIALVLLTLLYIVIEVNYIGSVILKPVKHITSEASRFAKEGTVTEKLTEKVKNKDEIGQLAQSIEHMEKQINDYVSNLTKITEERQRITTELTLAARIQADSLPNDFPAFPDKNEFDIYATMTPAKEVGGDFYDFFMIDDDHLYIVIADVSGKGVPAALFMMSSKNILGSNALKSLSPAEILENTNNAICKKNKEDMFITAWVGIFELSTGKLVASNAGHEYPFVREPNGSFQCMKDKHGLLLGEFPDVKYEEYEIQMTSGSKLFIYTDGLPEATDPDSKMFGMDKIADALNIDPQANPENLLGNVQSAVDVFVKDAEQFDDLTMLCLEFK